MLYFPQNPTQDNQLPSLSMQNMGKKLSVLYEQVW